MTALPQEKLARLVSLASQAPSIHNTQPWQWRETRTGLELRTDESRRLMYADAARRGLVMSCGAALHTLQVAAAAEGFAARVRRFPDPANPDVVASVTFVTQPVTPEAITLAAAIPVRRTDRRPVSSWPVPEERIRRLAALAADRGVRITNLESTRDHGRLLKLMKEATRAQSGNEAYLDELLAWSHDREGTGVPASSRLSPEASAQLDVGVHRFPAGTLSTSGGGGSGSEEPSAEEWLILSTSSDDQLSWLRAGEALQAVWLWATCEGLSLVPFSQPLEVQHTRRALQEEHLDDTGCPQLLLRLGWPPVSRETVTATPRRHVQSVLQTLPSQRERPPGW